MGCILPTEPTSASVAAASLVAQFGPKAIMLSYDEIIACYQGVKVRLKQLYKAEPSRFIHIWPSSPAELVRMDRALALTLFSRAEPPVACPLNRIALERLRARISMRGGGMKGCLSAAGASLSFPHPSLSSEIL